MAKPDNLLPESLYGGLVPTMNNTGFMTSEMDEYSKNFAVFAGERGTRGEESLDIGCAYGIATLAALDMGANIFACDIESKHLEILEQRVPAEAKNRFRCKQGTMPDVHFEASSFGAILAARVFHFLDGKQIEETLENMYRWLKPGGRLYLIVDTPYAGGPWYKYVGRYEKRKAAGDLWPGFVDDYADLLPEGIDPAEHPDFINPMDTDILARVCANAGFTVLSTATLSGSTANAKGNEHAGIIASKPMGKD